MNKKNKILILDGNNILHRAYHQYKSMRAEDGKITSMVFGFPYIVHALINLHRPSRVYVVFDGGRDARRLEILPTYKQRVKKEDFDYENFIEQKNVVMGMLTHLGIDYFHQKDKEADDYIYLLARKYGRKNQVVIVSTDKDFIQLINKNISIWNPFKNERITHINCEKVMGYTPEQCVDYLTLLGDKSDCIPGYKGVGEKTAKKFLDQVGSIENFLKDDKLQSNIKKELLQELYLVNKELIDIRYFVKKNNIKLADAKRIPGKFNMKEFKLLCADYNITKLQQAEVLMRFKQLYDNKGI